MPQRKRRLPDDAIIAALQASGGMVYLAARQLQIEPKTIYRRRDSSPKVAQAILDARGEMLDIAETSLKRGVIAGEAWAVCFTLKTIGKHRGYVERIEQEVTGRNGGALEVKTVFSHAAAVASATAGSGEDSA